MPRIPVGKLERHLPRSSATTEECDQITLRDALPADEPPEPEDPVDRVIAQSFPASDPPSWWTGANPG